MYFPSSKVCAPVSSIFAIVQYRGKYDAGQNVIPSKYLISKEDAFVKVSGANTLLFREKMKIKHGLVDETEK